MELLLKLVEEQSHQALIRGISPRAPICGLGGSVRKATGIPGRNTDIFKAVEDTGTSGGKGRFIDNLIILASLYGRYHYHQHLHHHQFAYKEFNISEEVADYIDRKWRHLGSNPGVSILMTGVLFSMLSHPLTFCTLKS